MMMMMMMRVNMGMLKAEALTASKPELRPALQSIAIYMRRGYILSLLLEYMIIGP